MISSGRSRRPVATRGAPTTDSSSKSKNAPQSSPGPPGRRAVVAIQTRHAEPQRLSHRPSIPKESRHV